MLQLGAMKKSMGKKAGLSLLVKDTSPDDRGALLLKPKRVRRRRRKLFSRHKTPNVSKSTSHRDSKTVVPSTASSSSVIDRFLKTGPASAKRPVSGKIKLCTRVLLPLILFTALIEVVSFLWIPPRHSRRPYSSLADDDYSGEPGSSSLEVKSYDSINNYSDDQSRRLHTSVGSFYRESSNFRSRLLDRCYDKGGPRLCSQPNACTEYPLLCKCTCASKQEID